MKQFALSVVSHNQQDEILDLLESLAKQKKIDEVQIILTINQGRCDIPAYFNDKLNLEIIFNDEALSFSINHNNAFKIAKSRYFIVSNPDVIIEDIYFIEKLIKSLNENSFELFSPTILNEDLSKQDFLRSNITLISLVKRILGFDKKANVETEFVWLTGVFMIFKSEAFRKLNGFNSNFRLYCEDYEISLRHVLNRKKICIFTNLYVIHTANRTSRKNPLYLWWHLSSILKVWTSLDFYKCMVNRPKSNIIFR